MSNLLTTVPALPFRSRIVFPSVPAAPPAPSLGYAAGGALAATTYYAKTTWIVETQDGLQYESLPSAETSLAVAADNVLVVSPPAPPPMPYPVIAWNVYVGASSDAEELQASMIPLSLSWTESTTGLIAGTTPPTEFGNELIFTYPGRLFPYFDPVWHGHDEFSTAGVQQTITWYIDQLTDFEVPYIEDGADAAAWKTFLQSAIQRVPFDFYQDSTLGSFVSLLMMDSNPKMEYRYPGLYQLKLKCRKVILA